MRDRYLRLLGIDGQPSGLDGLRLLTRRHLRAVPFENVSKLLLYDREGAGRAATADEFLNGIEQQDLGGTCYSNNPFFAGLLRSLGYDAELLGADMSKPDVHTCIRVRLDSAAYHVDVGFASPFREPIRLDRLPARIDEGGNHYLFDRGPAEGTFRMQMFIGEECRVSYLAHDPPRPPEHFAPAIGMSFLPGSTFMQHLRISRIFDGYSVDLWDRELFRHDAAGTSIRRLATMEELKAAVAEDLGLARCPVEAAVRALERLTGKVFFEAAGAA